MHPGGSSPESSKSASKIRSGERLDHSGRCHGTQSLLPRVSNQIGCGAARSLIEVLAAIRFLLLVCIFLPAGTGIVVLHGDG